MVRAIDLDKAIEIIEEKQKELCPVGSYGRHYVYGSDREKYDAWEEIIDALDALPTLTPPNEPLTLEELLRMDGTPVWLDVAGGMWALVDALDGCLWLDRGGSIDITKFAGKAYCRPPEGEI